MDNNIFTPEPPQTINPSLPPPNEKKMNAEKAANKRDVPKNEGKSAKSLRPRIGKSR